jgi:ElaB/YqjD/DUF883 family membrane-anchored ribosome-binding protein
MGPASCLTWFDSVSVGRIRLAGWSREHALRGRDLGCPRLALPLTRERRVGLSTQQTSPGPSNFSETTSSEETGVGQSTGERVTGQAREAGQQAREAAQQAAGQARGRLRQEVDTRTTQLGERVASTAQDVRSVGEELRKQDKEGPAGLAERVAERAERVAEYLKNADADALQGDAESFARERPWAVIAGGLTLGFVASRLLKASSGERYTTSQREASYTSDIRTPPTTPSPYDSREATGPVSTGVDLFDEPVAPVPNSPPSDVVAEDETSVEDPYRDDASSSPRAPEL